MKPLVLVVTLLLIGIANADAQSIKGGTRTPSCWGGTQKAIATKGSLLLKPIQYCVDPQNVVTNLRRAGTEFYWRVALTSGFVDCQCAAR